MDQKPSGDDTPKNTPHSNLRPPWQPGQSGNPKGRPKGARNKLSEAFFKTMLEEFEKNGPAMAQSVAAERPHEFLKILATLIRNADDDEEGGMILRAIFGGGRINRQLGH